MRPKFRAFVRYRPRLLTLVAFFVAAMVIALANLSFDESFVGFFDTQYRSYGWPLVWHRVVRSGWNNFGYRTVGWYYSVPRLAANLAMWLVMLAALAAASEWLLRRYPRLRWSLRSILRSARPWVDFVAISRGRQRPYSSVESPSNSMTCCCTGVNSVTMIWGSPSSMDNSCRRIGSNSSIKR